MSRAASILQKSKNESESFYSAKQIENAIKFGKTLFDVKTFNKELEENGFADFGYEGFESATKIKKSNYFISFTGDGEALFSIEADYMMDGEKGSGEFVFTYDLADEYVTSIEMH